MEAERPRPVVVAIAMAAFLGAPLSILLLIVRYGVNVAVQDQIRIGAFLIRNHDRLFPSLADLFAQHNESRKFFPRLIFFYLAPLTHWNVKAEMGVSLVLACAAVVAIGIVAWRTIPDRNVALLATAIAGLLLLSPVQWFNWLFGIQVVIFLPLLLLAIGVVVAEHHPVMAALCALVATYSYANGMLLWVLLGVVVVGRVRSRLFLWLLAASAAIGAYFIGYHKPVDSPPLIFRPIVSIKFMLAFLGHPLAGDSLPANVFLGALGVVLFAILFARGRLAALPWAAFGMYSILSAAVTALGRLGHGEQYAIEPRYTTFAAGLWIAIVMMAAMTLGRRALAIGAVGLLVLHSLAIVAAWPRMRESYRDRLLARVATQFAFVLPDNSLLQRLVEREVNSALAVISGLAKIGYVNPPPVDSDIAQRLDGGGDPARHGAFEGALRLDGKMFLYGWALLPDGRPADAVLITRMDRDGDHVVALSERTVIRTNIAGMGWDLPARRRVAEPGATYRAWAYDSSARRAYRLAGSISVRNAARY